MELDGFVEGLSNSDYHAGEGISKSDLDLLHVSPAMYRYSKLAGVKKESKALTFGSAFHSLILEPERNDVAVKVRGEGQPDGKILISQSEYDSIIGMRESLAKVPVAQRLIEQSKHEISVFAKQDGVLCKCRPDGWIWDEGEGLAIDLKSTTDASPAGFARSVANFRYHVQAAWYLHLLSMTVGEDVEHFIFIAVEKTPPYQVAVYELDEDALIAGWMLAESDLRVYKKAVETDTWEAYPKRIQKLSLPKWALNEIYQQ